MSDKEKGVLITNADKQRLLEIRKIVEKQDLTDGFCIDYETQILLETIDRAINNLEYGWNYYKKVEDTEKTWFDAQCDDCGWSGSSQYLLGGGAIADTGDHDDCYCPVCGSNKVG